jgi:hypothetical protein
VRRAIIWVVTGALAVAALAAPSAQAANEPPTRSCGWPLRISGDQLNVVFPDDYAKYWVGVLPIPPGGHIEVKGRFPHARYMSLITYSALGQAVDGIADEEVVPDAGSTNPYVAGADRTAANRSYTLRIVNQRVPAARAPNTVYTENADGSKTSRPLQGSAFVLRVYEPDAGRDDTGGVGLPDVAVVTGDGRRIALPRCPALNLPDLGLTKLLADSGGRGAGPDTGLAGRNPPRWKRFTGIANSLVSALDNERTGDTLYPPLAQLTNRLPTGGFFENVHNAYVFTTVSRGPGEVVVFRGRAPTFAHTHAGEPIMGTGQLRYWSFCSNIITTQFLGCRNDTTIPVGDDGRYRIAISTKAARPANATDACGMAWLPSSAFPATQIIYRHMLPAPSFAEAIQRVRPGQEQAEMGEYYPVGTYYKSKEAVEALGCPAP